MFLVLLALLFLFATLAPPAWANEEEVSEEGEAPPAPTADTGEEDAAMLAYQRRLAEIGAQLDSAGNVVFQTPVPQVTGRPPKASDYADEDDDSRPPAWFVQYQEQQARATAPATASALLAQVMERHPDMNVGQVKVLAMQGLSQIDPAGLNYQTVLNAATWAFGVEAPKLLAEARKGGQQSARGAQSIRAAGAQETARPAPQVPAAATLSPDEKQMLAEMFARTGVALTPEKEAQLAARYATARSRPLSSLKAAVNFDRDLEEKE